MVPSIEKIELAIMNNELFNFRQNLIVFRVSDFSGIVNHECDCLIMSKSGYLTEIEIKRSYSDFLADFRKKHCHQDGRVKKFYFLVHESFADKVRDKLIELKHVPSAIYVYDDNSNIKLFDSMHSFCLEVGLFNKDYVYYGDINARKLFIEEKYQLARLGAMRYKNMTERIINLKKDI